MTVLVGLYSRSREANKLPLFCSPAEIDGLVVDNKVNVKWCYDTPNRPKGTTSNVPVSWCRYLHPSFDVVESVKQGKNVYKEIDFEQEMLPERRHYVEDVLAKGYFDDEDVKNQPAVLIKWNGYDYAASTWESLAELMKDKSLSDDDVEVCGRAL